MEPFQKHVAPRHKLKKRYSLHEQNVFLEIIVPHLNSSRDAHYFFQEEPMASGFWAPIAKALTTLFPKNSPNAGLSRIAKNSDIILLKYEYLDQITSRFMKDLPRPSTH